MVNGGGSDLVDTMSSESSDDGDGTSDIGNAVHFGWTASARLVD